MKASEETNHEIKVANNQQDTLIAEHCRWHCTVHRDTHECEFYHLLKEHNYELHSVSPHSPKWETMSTKALLCVPMSSQILPLLRLTYLAEHTKAWPNHTTARLPKLLWWGMYSCPPAAYGRWKPPWQGPKLSASTPSIIATPLLFHFNLPKSRQTQCNKTHPWHLVTVNIGSAAHLYCFCSRAEQKGISKTLCRHHVKAIPERSKTTNPSYPLFSTLPLLPPFHMALKGVLTKTRVLAAFMCIIW